MSPENLERLKQHDRLMLAAMRLKEYYECTVAWRGTTAEGFAYWKKNYSNIEYFISGRKLVSA